MLVSGGSDGLLIIWSAEHGHDSRDFAPKYSLKVLNTCPAIAAQMEIP